MSTLAYWRRELARHPILAGWLLIFAVHAGMNAKLGHEMGGSEGLGALLYAAAFLGFAVLGAWAADQIGEARGTRRMGLVTVALLQLAIGQMAGWQAMGLTLNKGAATLEAKADARRTTKDGLDGARAELAGIGTVRPIEAVRAEATLECEIKSRTYKDGVGPKCTKLRAELATAERAAQLRSDIERLTGRLASGPAVKDANALYQAPQGIVQGLVNAWAWMMGGTPATIAPDDIRFGWMVFLVFALEFFGTFGLALVRGAGGHGGGSGRSEPQPSPAGSGQGSGEPVHTMREAIEAVMGSARRALPAPPQLAAISGPDGGSSYAVHGAPISIHFAAPAPPSDPSGAAREPGTTGSRRPSPASMPMRDDLPALPADAPPVDRSRIMRALAPEERAAADVILAFRAACLRDTPGAVVSAFDVHARYAAWAGARTIEAGAFVRLLADVAGLEPVAIAGAPHYRDVALRMAPQLEAVA